MSERTYTESEMRSIATEAWDRGFIKAGVPADEIGLHVNTRLQQIDAILRDHGAQPASMVCSTCRHLVNGQCTNMDAPIVFDDESPNEIYDTFGCVLYGRPR